jgi:hypothetical protein
MAESAFKITGSVMWRAMKGCKLRNQTVLIEGMGDFYGYQRGPAFDAETVIVHRCDKNFVHYTIRPAQFPKVKTLYLNSHPCEPQLLGEWGRIERKPGEEPPPTLWLSDWFGGYKRRWSPDYENIKVMPQEELARMIEELRPEAAEGDLGPLAGWPEAPHASADNGHPPAAR